MAAQRESPENQKEQPLTLDEARLKIASYCAYQERAHQEVIEKLYSYGLHRDEVEDLLAWLITENYVNEERFATAYAGGKFRVKGWGKLKIERLLQQKGVSSYSIDKAIDLIEEDEYIAAIRKLIEQKKGSVKAPNIYEYRHKIARFVINRGFEPDKVWQEIVTIITE